MQQLQNNAKSKKKDFNPKDANLVFFSFSLFCMVVIGILIAKDVLAMQNFLSFDRPLQLLSSIVISTFILLVYGIVLTIYIPSKYIDDTNKSYQNYALPTLVTFMCMAALFEELLFRGIIQNLLSVFLEDQWKAIIITAFIFIGFHVQYFKKPIMLVNIAIPCLLFGWIYFETNNILVPFSIYLLMNLGLTLLLKYKLISAKR